MPVKYDITVNSGYNGSLQEDDNVNLFYTRKELLNLGEIVYRLDQELVNKALRKYFYSKEKNTLKLYEYAKKMKIYKKVRIIFEILW